jgi:hypothetical protein
MKKANDSNNKHVIEVMREGKIEVMVRQGRRRKRLLDDTRKREDTENWKRKH